MAERTEPASEGIELRAMDDGRGDGVVATRPFAPGEVVVAGHLARWLSENSKHATQMDIDRWALLAGLAPHVNHSCDPNCGVRVNDEGAFDLVALRPIAGGEEVTFDYAMRNFTVDHFPPRCLCGAAACRGTITGWKDLPAERKRAYRGFVAPYLLAIDEEAQAGLAGRRGGSGR